MGVITHRGVSEADPADDDEPDHEEDHDEDLIGEICRDDWAHVEFDFKVLVAAENGEVS